MSTGVIFRDWVGSFAVGGEELEGLIATAREDARRRARICLHRSHGDSVQEMVIAVTPGCYIPPHRQRTLEKSYVALRGSLRIGFYDEHGALEKIVDVASSIFGSPVLVRFDAGRWHTAIPMKGEAAIYIETITGPFDPSRTEWAKWAPAEHDELARGRFLDHLEKY